MERRDSAMLKKIRTGLAIAFFISLTLLFLDFTGSLQTVLGFTSKTQFLPALMALNIGVILAMTALTFILGRVYCSVICPLGVFQDVVSKISSKFKKSRFKYSLPKTKTRYIILGFTIASIIAGFSLTTILLDPYAFYGRITSSFFAPVYRYGNNLLAVFAENYNNYDIYEVSVKIPELLTLSITSVSLIAVAVLAWRNGRTYCNTICPVGTFLGFISKFSLFKHEIELSKCNSCGLCARNCKASCIDPKNHEIDYSRCVTCFDCIGNCRRDAIQYKVSLKSAKQIQPEIITSNLKSANANTRRNFIALTSLFALSQVVKAQTVKVDGGFADIADKVSPVRATAIVPPGSESIANLEKHCTACQLCISNCPNNVLISGNNPIKPMQPVMSYENGYCRPECVKCSEFCPTGAISKITNIEKSAIKIGTAIWIKEKCLIYTEEIACNNCARHCPTGAIFLIPSLANDPNSPKIVVVNNDRCIGCGACENLCPSRPLSAIYVEGCEVHRTV